MVGSLLSEVAVHDIYLYSAPIPTTWDWVWYFFRVACAFGQCYFFWVLVLNQVVKFVPARERVQTLGLVECYR